MTLADPPQRAQTSMSIPFGVLRSSPRRGGRSRWPWRRAPDCGQAGRMVRIMKALRDTIVVYCIANVPEFVSSHALRQCWYRDQEGRELSLSDSAALKPVGDIHARRLLPCVLKLETHHARRRENIKIYCVFAEIYVEATVYLVGQVRPPEIDVIRAVAVADVSVHLCQFRFLLITPRSIVVGLPEK